MKRPGSALRISSRTPPERGAAPLETAISDERSHRSGCARIASATGRPIASPRKVSETTFLASTRSRIFSGSKVGWV